MKCLLSGGSNGPLIKDLHEKLTVYAMVKILQDMHDRIDKWHLHACMCVSVLTQPGRHIYIVCWVFRHFSYIWLDLLKISLRCLFKILLWNNLNRSPERLIHNFVLGKYIFLDCGYWWLNVSICTYVSVLSPEIRLFTKTILLFLNFVNNCTDVTK